MLKGHKFVKYMLIPYKIKTIYVMYFELKRIAVVQCADFLVGVVLSCC